MANRGLSRPRLNAGIAAAIAVAGLAAIAIGIRESALAGGETTLSGVLIGGGIVPALIGIGMTANFLWGARVIDRIRRGDKAIGRWTVSAGEFDAFRTADRERNALGPDYSNNYRPPRVTPPDGVEVIFVEDGVLVGGTYFGLVTTGMFRFAGVQVLPGNPMCIEFGSITTTLSNATTVRVDRSVAVLRIPIARTATDAAGRVLEHFQNVDARKTIVNRGFYPSRIRIGLWGALIFAAIGAAGFGLEALDADFGLVPLVMAVVGAVTAVGGLALAFVAWLLYRQQLQGG